VPSQALCRLQTLQPVSLWECTVCFKEKPVCLRIFESFVPELTTGAGLLSVVIEIGGMPVRVNTTDHNFLDMLHERYAGYVSSTRVSEIEFDVQLEPPGKADPSSEVRVAQRGGRWTLARGDFRAEWEPAEHRGWIQQTPTPYSIDSVLRIVHTLVLARRGGFLLHAASAIRNGRAFIFAGASGAGKSTISKLAPRDVALLSDEISYVQKREAGYVASGTPFTGELDKPGENISAPVAALYLLAKGSENRIDVVTGSEAARLFLQNVLFFAEDEELVQRTFHAAFDFVSCVPVFRLTFVPDVRVWELIR